MKNIHVFGDSHTSIFLSINKCKINHLGPVTVHRVGRDGIFSLLDKNKINTIKNKRDYFLFCFGEIDVRNHINTYVKNGKNKLEIIFGLCDKYIDAINQLNYKNIFIYNVIPPPLYIEKLKQYECPVNGSDYELLDYNNIMNKCLFDLCNKYGFKFIDIRSYIVDKKGFLDNNRVINYLMTEDHWVCKTLSHN